MSEAKNEWYNISRRSIINLNEFNYITFFFFQIVQFWGKHISLDLIHSRWHIPLDINVGAFLAGEKLAFHQRHVLGIPNDHANFIFLRCRRCDADRRFRRQLSDTKHIDPHFEFALKCLVYIHIHVCRYFGGARGKYYNRVFFFFFFFGQNWRFADYMEIRVSWKKFFSSHPETIVHLKARNVIEI